MTDQVRDMALQEIAFCARVLAKGGQTVLTEILRDAETFVSWQQYPEPNVFDPQTGGQWFYHSHDIASGDPKLERLEREQLEHGHFHCFVRPDGPDGPIHHLCAVGVDAYGRISRLFTVNQWVVGDDWLDAEATMALLPRFDVHMPRPSYLVNRWLTAILAAYEPEITGLIQQRDSVLAAHQPPKGIAVREDKGLEVTSEHLFDFNPARPDA